MFSRVGDCVARMGHANAVTPTSPGFMQSGHSSGVRVLASGSRRQQRWRLPWPRSRQYASRRSKTLEMPPLRRSGSGPLHLLVDSTGLKLGGAGEWLVEKHGTSRRRSWRKLHLGVDAESGEILAIELTRKEIDDAARSGALLDQITDPIASFTADGAYDQDKVCEGVAERYPDAAVIVPPRAT